METVNIKAIQLDLKKPKLTTIGDFIQNDTNIIKFTLTDNGSVIDLDVIDQILINYKKPSGEVISRVVTAEADVITYQLGFAEMSEAGLGKLVIQFFKSDNRISTFTVDVNIKKSIEGNFAFEEAEKGLVDQVIQELNLVNTRIDNIAFDGVDTSKIATKEDLKTLATKTELTDLATKTELSRLTTKEEENRGQILSLAEQIQFLQSEIESLKNGNPIPPDITPPILTITPASTFISTQVISMSTNETATIYYTLNGSTPTVSSSVYSTPLTISTTTTLKAFAKDSTGNISAVQTVVYTLSVPEPGDTTPPTNVTNLNASNISTNSVILSWAASASSDVVGYEIFNGNTLITSIAGTTYTITGLIPNTDYVFSVKAKDGSNNISSGTSLNVKTLNPTVSVTGVSLDRTIITTEEGKTITLVAAVQPTNATNKNVIWTSNNEEIATVNSSGVVNTLIPGNVVITVKTVDGNFTANCNIAVTQTIQGFDYNNLVAYGTDTHVTFDQTVNGESDFVHPSVLYFDQGWNGHKYWMGINPYPNTQGTFENPFLFYSDDGDNWSTPNGLTQPIFPKEADVGNNSDSHIFMDYDGVTMHYLNRGAFTDGGSMTEIFSTTNGVNFTPRKRILSTKNSPADPDYVSPSVCLVDGKYYMFATDVTDLNTLCVLEATDVYGKWTEINRISTGTLGQMWHCEVRYLNQEFIVLGSTGYISGGNLMLGKFASVNDEIIVGRNNAFMKPLGASPWNAAIYKSSLVYKSNEDIEIFIGNKGTRLDATTDWRVARVKALRVEQTLNLSDYSLVSSPGTLTTTRTSVDYNKYAIEGTVVNLTGAIVAFGDSTNQHANLRIKETILVAQLWGAEGGTIERNIHYGISIGDKVTIVKDVHVDFYINGRLIHRFENGGEKLNRNGVEFFSLDTSGNYADVKIYKKNDHFYSVADATNHKQTLVTEYATNPENFIMYDEFNRANGIVGISDNNKTWEIVGSPIIENNALKPNGKDTNAVLTEVSGNYQIVFDVSKTGNNPMYGVYLKYTDSNNFIKYTLTDGQPRFRYIDVKENGVETRTTFTTYGDSYLNHKLIKLEVVNNILRMYEDNLLIGVKPIPDKPFNNKVGFTSNYNTTSYDYIIIKKLT